MLTPSSSAVVIQFDQQATPPRVDTDQAFKFLRMIDANASAFTFQTFKEKGDNGSHISPRVIHSQSLAELRHEHAGGGGIYLAINETDGAGRKTENITRIRAVFQEDDDSYDGAFPLTPSVVVESSPGHFHRYWLVRDAWPTDEKGRSDFASVMERMVETYGSDKNAKDISRVLRLPGFWHRKAVPFMVRIIEASGRRYTRAEIVAAFPPIERQQSKPHTEWKPRGDGDERIRQALDHIDADDRDVWLQIAMALKDEMGDTGRPLWDEWSRRSNKFNERDQEKTWRSLRRHGIGIGTLFHHAKAAGWKGTSAREGERDTPKAEGAMPRLQPISLNKFFSLSIKPREMVLAPVIPEKGLAMVYASRGTGKTHVALGVGYAVATGTKFLKWQAPKPRRVLLIDGEMPAASLQERLASIVAGAAAEPDENALRILAGDLIEEGGIGNLASPEMQVELDPWLADTDLLLLLDNLSSLTAVFRDNDQESWGPIQDWLLRLRRRNTSVVIFHHAGKGGQQRGTSRREDVLDTVISLRHPDDYSPAEGARFEVHIETGRGLLGDDAKPFEAKLEVTDNAAVWAMREIEDVEMARVKALLDDELSVREIAEETGISKSKVQRLKKKIEAERGTSGGGGDSNG